MTTTTPTPHRTAGFGWIPDLPDHRDHRYAAPAHITAALPSFVDLTSHCPPVYDQGQLGSCTGNAIAGAIEYTRIRAGGQQVTPSRLFIYYNERVIEQTVRTDAGAMIRDGIKSVHQQGVCAETTWPYIVAKFARRPVKAAYTEAATRTVTGYQRVDQSIDQIRAAIAAGNPIVFGFTVYDSFESDAVAHTGVVDLPTAGQSVLGGHAVLAVGYTDADRRILVRNSWGPDWGRGGYFTMPYDYITNPNLAGDLWVITAATPA